jgi:hypothetical protein
VEGGGGGELVGAEGEVNYLPQQFSVDHGLEVVAYGGFSLLLRDAVPLIYPHEDAALGACNSCAAATWSTDVWLQQHHMA